MSKKRVLVVDDSMFVYMELVKFFENSEFEIAAFCQSGEEAINIYEKISPDIVVMDIIMPGVDGIEASRQIRSKWPQAKILVASALMDDEVISAVKDFGGIGIVQKPLERDKLLAMLCNAFEDLT